MVKVSEIKADVEALKASQHTKAEGGEPLLKGFKVSRTGKLTELTSYDGTSCTVLHDRDWGTEIPEGGFVLPAAVVQILRTIDKQAEITLLCKKKGQIEIKQGSSKWKFPMSLDTSNFLDISKTVMSESSNSICLSVDAELLREALVSVRPSIGEENSGYCCSQITFSPEKGELTAVSTDTRRSTVWQAVNVKYSPASLPLPEYRLTIPGSKMLSLAKFLQEEGTVEVHFTNSVVVFKSKTQTLAIRLLNVDNYPPILKLFSITPIAAYTITPKELVNALKRAKVLLPDSKIVSQSTLLLNFEGEILTIGHESDLFTDSVPCQPLSSAELTTPPKSSIALNLDYLKAALSLLSENSCDIKFNPQISSISSNTLNGVVTHFIATIHRSQN